MTGEELHEQRGQDSFFTLVYIDAGGIEVTSDDINCVGRKTERIGKQVTLRSAKDTLGRERIPSKFESRYETSSSAIETITEAELNAAGTKQIIKAMTKEKHKVSAKYSLTTGALKPMAVVTTIREEWSADWKAAISGWYSGLGEELKADCLIDNGSGNVKTVDWDVLVTSRLGDGPADSEFGSFDASVSVTNNDVAFIESYSGDIIGPNSQWDAMHSDFSYFQITSPCDGLPPDWIFGSGCMYACSDLLSMLDNFPGPFVYSFEAWTQAYIMFDGDFDPLV